MKKEAADSSETLVPIIQITRKAVDAVRNSQIELSLQSDLGLLISFTRKLREVYIGQYNSSFTFQREERDR
jgi:hypothetical protein